MTFREESCDDFLLIFQEYHKHIRDAEGCLGLSLLRDEWNKNIFFTYSIWDSQQSLEKYRNSEVFSIVWPKTKALFVSPAEAWSTKEIYNL